MFRHGNVTDRVFSTAHTTNGDVWCRYRFIIRRLRDLDLYVWWCVFNLRCNMQCTSLHTLSPLLFRYVLSFLEHKEQVRTVGRLRCTYRGYARTLQAAPLESHYEYWPLASLTAPQAQQWVRSATYMLTSLRVFVASRQTPGVLFACLKHFTTLRTLGLSSLSEDDFEADEATLPPMPLLTNLEVSYCNAFADNNLGKQSMLQDLCLNGCPQFQGTALASLRTLTSMRVSYCNQFTGTGLTELALLQLCTVTSCPQFRGSSVWSSLNRLVELHMVKCDQFTGHHLATLTRLRRLHVNWCKQFVTAAAVPFANLTELRVSHCRQFTGEGLSRRTRLRHFSIEELPSFQPVAWSLMSDLCSLRVRNVANVTDDVIAALRGLPHLHCVKLEFCSQLRGDTLDLVTSLTSLSIASCRWLTVESLENLRHLPCLRDLQFYACPQLCDDVLGRLTLLTNLTSLVLAVSQRITDEGISELRRLPSLRHLNLRWCNQLHGTTLSNLTNLTSLSVSACLGVTRTRMAALRTLPFLQIDDD